MWKTQPEKDKEPCREEERKDKQKYERLLIEYEAKNPNSKPMKKKLIQGVFIWSGFLLIVCIVEGIEVNFREFWEGWV